MFRKKHLQRFYTIMVIPHAASLPRSLKLSLGLICAGVSLCLLILSITLYSAFYFYKLSGYYQDKAAGMETRLGNYQEINDLSGEVRDINKSLDDLRERLNSLDEKEKEIKRLIDKEISEIPGSRPAPDNASPVPSGDNSMYQGRGGASPPPVISSPTVSRNMVRLKDPQAVLAAREEINNLSGQLKKYEETFEIIKQAVIDDLEFYRTVPRGVPAIGNVTSRFAVRVSPFDRGRTEMHYGIDLAAPFGSPVKAAGDGEVVFSGYDHEFGNMLVIDHGNGFETHYGHNSELLVKAGDMVKKGQTVSLMGNSGYSTGPHLHYAVKYRGEFIDPFILLEPGVLPESG